MVCDGSDPNFAPRGEGYVEGARRSRTAALFREQVPGDGNPGFSRRAKSRE